MKVIDLLNKIANGKEYRNCNLIWHSKITGKNEEENINVLDFICERLFCQDLTLNDEVEIAEEPEEKKIPEKLEDIIKGDCIEAPNNFILMDKINELIDYLDYLKSKGD